MSKIVLERKQGKPIERYPAGDIDDERVCIWPDGTWCYECDLSEMGHKSDDHQILPAQFFFTVVD